MANKNSNLGSAKANKNDEFYTQYPDIQKEVNAYIEYDPDTFRDKTVLLPCDDPEWSNFTKFFAQNFERYGLKKLISTSYARLSKKTRYGIVNEPTLFEMESEIYDEDKSRDNGRIFILERKDISGDGRVDYDDLTWDYLEGDGDFRSEEVRRLRDEADVIVTNPPFSMFREFLSWIMEAGKKFLVIGNMNAITYKEVFPLIKENRVWLGSGFSNGNAYFKIPESASTEYAEGVYDQETKLVKFRNCCWFTNLDHGRRHQPLSLMTMADNLKFSRHKDIRGKAAYDHYDNYDAIEVPYTDAIPSDYIECLGVPISFLDKYCPFQYEIIGATESEGKGFSAGLWDPESGVAQAMIRGNKVYKRLFIKKLVGGANYRDLIEIIVNMGIERDDIVYYSGIMGVPISFLDKYCPNQFDILGISLDLGVVKPNDLPKEKQGGPAFYTKENGIYKRQYCRIAIRHKQNIL